MVVSTESGEMAAVTQNISASGVLFAMESPLKKGAHIHFSLFMPSAVLGTPRDILVYCQGRVVRCSMSQSKYQAASTIDEYRFEEQ